ncbi:CoA transferase [Sinorhizobium mexicanum]|uniref:2-methylfumaryl-CoA isomerase n=1 Tax=Sinorhizobium mexicanum TaxID=375549 RepID=A0A859R278_9HYPH|nr:CoA transferase [Sinorhizobium mexicanum]MBP1888090.1 2-methylfumaryl-CoA isomerase [Sinorhizobium mexicanum]QLL65699.1 2-methylfumaryl-CoA isomerase [Sinorhizobium mexicanum]
MTYDLLSGTRIIESSAFIAAPLGGLTLAQMGADVIRVDAIGGGIDYRRLPLMPEGRSIYWTSLNKNKRSIAIDLKRAEGRELVADLVTAPGDGGGILLSNIPAKWLDPAALAKMRPDLISCLIEGNPDGTTAVDYTVNCATGIPAITGDGSVDRPVNQALPAWDLACALQASTAIASALVRRKQTGQGAQMRLALADTAFSLLSHLGILTEAELLPDPRTAIGNDIYGAFGRDFGTADHQRLMVAAISLRQWQALVEACDMADAIAAIERTTAMDFKKETDRFEGRDLIAALVKQWCRSRTLAEIALAFDRAGVCWGRYATTREALANDPRLSASNPVFERVRTEGVGAHLSAGAAVRIVGDERAPVHPAAKLGADTDTVLAEVLGLSSSEIGRLHEKGIVAGPDAAEPS